MKTLLLCMGLCALMATLPGCGGSQAVTPVVGGTPGHLRSGNDSLPEMRVTVYGASSSDPLGFAETAADGTFSLVKNQASGPLVLESGDYRFTVESAGAPVVVPKEYLKPETTPFRVTWPTPSQKVELLIPQTLIQ